MTEQHDHECAVLGALIEQEDLRGQLIPRMQVEDFTSLQTRAVYSAIASLHTEGAAVDIVAVAERLEMHNAYEASGGMTALAEMTFSPVMSGARRISELMIADSVRRRIKGIAAAVSKLDRGADPAATIEKIREDLDQAAFRMDARATQWRGLMTMLDVEQLAQKPPPIIQIVEGLIPEAAAMLLVGIGGAGKTSLLLSLACAIATGEIWAGRRTRQGKTLYITAEDRATRLTGRLQHFLAGATCPHKTWHHVDIAANISIYDVSRVSHYLVAESNAGPVVTESLQELRHIISKIVPQLVVLDPAALFVQNENDNAMMACLMRELNGIADDHKCAIIFCSHTSKAAAREGIADAHAARGASALGDNGRGTLVLRDAGKDDDCPLRAELASARDLIGKDCDLVVLENPRQSIIKRSDPIWFVRGAGGAILPLGTGKRRSVDQKRDERHDKGRSAILGALAMKEWLPQSELKALLDEVGGRRDYLEIIADLIDDGLIEEFKLPGGAGRPKKLLRIITAQK